MPTDASLEPLTAAIISSTDVPAHLANLVSLKDRVASGYTVSVAGSNATVVVGIAIIGGVQVGRASDPNKVIALTDNATNTIYIQKNGNFTQNTTGVPPATSLAIASIVMTAGVASAPVDLRVLTVEMQAPVKGQSFEANGSDPYLKGKRADLSGVTPEAKFTDTVTGIVRKVVAQNSKLQVVDGAGGVLNDDISTPSLAVDETDTNATKNKSVSNLLAKGWQDHKNAAAPHSGHEVTSAKGAASGYAGLDGASRVPATNAPAKAVYATAGAQALAPSDIGAEATANKGVANGYASLDAGGVVPSAQMRQATNTAKGAAQLSNATPQDATHPGMGTSGTSNDVSRADHAHAHGDMSTESPATAHHSFGQVTGTLSDTQHGSRGGGSLHANATGSVAGFLPAADKAKLDSSTSSEGASSLVMRDASGRASFIDPTAAQNAATKTYVDTGLAGKVGTGDSRLTDARTPTGAAGGDLAGTYPNPTFAVARAKMASGTYAGAAGDVVVSLPFRPKIIHFVVINGNGWGFIIDTDGAGAVHGSNNNSGIDNTTITIQNGGFTAKAGSGLNGNGTNYAYVAYA